MDKVTACPRSTTLLPLLATLSLALALALALPAPTRASTAYNWAAAVSGTADETAKWSPVGLPGASDYLYWNVGGSYQVVFPATVAATTAWTVYSGDVTLAMTSPHTTNQFYIGNSGQTTTVNLGPGTLGSAGPNGTYLQLGTNNSTSTLNVNGAGVALTAVGYVGYGTGTATMNVTGTAHLEVSTTNLQVGTNYQGAGTLNVAGFNSFTFTRSTIHTAGDPAFPLAVGGSGTGAMNIYGGAAGDVESDLHVGSLINGSGTLTLGPGSILSSSWLNVHRDLTVSNAPPSNFGGHGEVLIENRSWISVGGQTYMGDPEQDFGHELHVYQGGLLLTNGLTILAQTLGAPLPLLDFRGGLIHVHGGTFSWPAATPLTISSQVGSPEMWIANGAAAQGPSTSGGSPQLYVGRAGYGALRVLRPGTVLACGLGATVLGDSTGGVGKVVVDSAGTYSATGYTKVGNNGTGEFDVLNGAAASLGVVRIGNGLAAAADTGTVIVRGAGTTATVHDLLDVGGTGGNLSPGVMVVDSGATCSVVTGGIYNPPVITTYSGTGRLTVRDGGKLTSTGPIQNSGSIVLQQAEIDAQSLYSSGSFSGSGKLGANTTIAGPLALFSNTDAFGTLRVQGTYLQISSGHYQATLGTNGAPHSDTLIVSGAATLGGTLDLVLDASFVRTVGDTFTVVQCGSRTGTFATVTWDGAPLAGRATIVYGATSVKVVMNAPTTAVEPGPQVTRLRFAPTGERSAVGFVLELPAAADVDVRLYDVTGREAAVLASGTLGAGIHDLRLADGPRGLASGAYFARADVRTGGGTQRLTARVTLTR